MSYLQEEIRFRGMKGVYMVENLKWGLLHVFTQSSHVATTAYR